MIDIMKNLIRVTFLASFLSVVVVGCGGSRKSESVAPRQTAEDTVTATVPQFVRGRVVEDTVIGHWAIKALKDSNDVIVGRHDWAVRDSSVFLTLSHDRNIVYSDKEIRTKDVVGNEGEYIMQCGGEVFGYQIRLFTYHLAALFLTLTMAGICCIKFCPTVHQISLSLMYIWALMAFM